MNKVNILVQCILSLLLFSCSDKESLNALGQSDVGVLMSAPNFVSGEIINASSRSSLTPSLGGTLFKWDEGDVAGVYSSGKGLTNFFIDETTISSDGATAQFNGSGFILSPDSKYYAFYPYNAGALDKCKIPVVYSGQNLSHNGAFKELGKYDYMFASGMTNPSGNVSFDFNHIGCVVEFLLQVPETAVYSQVRFELEKQNNEKTFAKSGYVDLTNENTAFVADDALSSDTIMRVDLNYGEGISVKKDSLLKVYMMSAPQDLSGQNIVIRLVDSNSKWYTAKVSGKNMKSGRTYHYNITDDSEFGGFTGKGQGLPDDYTYKYISSYKDANVKSYEDLIVDGTMVYAVGAFGVRKINYADERNPYVEQERSFGLSSMRYRSIAERENYLYVSMRQGSAGAQENIVPEIKLNFETHAEKYSNELSNNNVINNFFQYLALLSSEAKNVTLVYIYKAYKKSDNEYRNSILLKFNNGKFVTFEGTSYPTRETALNALKSTYKTNNGDECIVDWSSVGEGANVIRNIQMNNMGQFHSYKCVGSASIDETGSPCPNTGLYSARLVTGNTVQAGDKAVLTRSIGNLKTDGELSFWIKPSCLVNERIVMPLLSEGTNEKMCLALQKEASKLYSTSLIIDGKVYNSKIKMTNAEWCNVKITIHSTKVSFSYRKKETGSWLLVENYTLPNSVLFDAINVGIESQSPNVLIYLDDLYYSSDDIDECSYVNGKLLVLNKNDLSKVNSYSLDLKGTECRIYGNVLIMNLLRGFNIYDITDPTNPKLTFTHRYPGYKECQGVDVYEANGHIYAFICNYSEGFTIVDVTNIENPYIVAINDDTVVYDGVNLQGKSYNFDVVVDYPYAYLTHCPTKSYIGTEQDYRGVRAINISSPNNIKSELIAVPMKDLYNKMTGDHCPISIDKYGNTLFIDNGEKGILLFDISDKSQPKYLQSIGVGDKSQVGTIRTTQDGRIFISENGKDCCIKLYRAE